MPFRLGATELIIILLIIMVVFGAAKLPQLGAALGKSIRDFRKEASGEADKKIEGLEVNVSKNSEKPAAVVASK